MPDPENQDDSAQAQQNPTTNEALIAFARDTAVKFLGVNARIDAVRGFAGVLAVRAGMTEAEAAAALNRCEAHAYEKALLRLEDKDPGLAADLDQGNQ